MRYEDGSSVEAPETRGANPSIPDVFETKKLSLDKY
jgi:hypothetical protein